jgi:hypothetical protein
MARALSDILRRFRPAVAPGPAGPAGVPADRVAEAAEELAGVFVALEDAVGEARAIRDEAHAAADRDRRQGAADAAAILADARARLEAVRAEAASSHLAELDAERAAIEAGARAEAERVGRVSEDRLPALVAKVVAGVWAGVDGTESGRAASEQDEAAG